MSYANGTTHYNLPLTTGSDKRDWADTNQAFTDVDAALHGAVQDTAQAEVDIDALETRMNSAEQNISTNTGNIAGLDARVTTVEGAVSSLSGQVTDTRQDLEDMICAYNEASATSTHAYAIGDYFIYNDVLYKATQVIAIGDTIVPDTNCSTTNVATELLTTEDLSDDVTQLQTDVAGLQTTTSTLTSEVNSVVNPNHKTLLTGAQTNTAILAAIANELVLHTYNECMRAKVIVYYPTESYIYTFTEIDLTDGRVNGKFSAFTIFRSPSAAAVNTELLTHKGMDYCLLAQIGVGANVLYSDLTSLTRDTLVKVDFVL